MADPGRPAYAIDASAIIALVRDEPGAERVEQALAEVDAPGRLSSLPIAPGRTWTSASRWS